MSPLSRPSRLSRPLAVQVSPGPYRAGIGVPRSQSGPEWKVEHLSLLQDLHAENSALAQHNRTLFNAAGALVVNLMSSPGAGKTRLLESTLGHFSDRWRCAVLEGDQETELDTARIRRLGVPCWQITTGNACHLDARLVHDRLHEIDLANLDVLFIENVGNLICPASFDLGQHVNVTLLSVTEGADKPAKYPAMFRCSDLLLLTKIDLLPWLDDFDPDRAEGSFRDLANPAPMLRVSPRTGSGMEHWFDWLITRRCERTRLGSTVAADRHG